MAHQHISKKFTVEIAEAFADQIDVGGAYYMFAAKHTPYATSDQAIPEPGASVKATTVDIYNDMIFGKRIRQQDVSLMIPRHDWVTNTTFDMYDDTDTELFSKPFFACVNAGAYSHVYKCLYNNNGAPSTVEPTGTDIYPFETPGDGYIWKYMFTANDYTMSKFATNEFMPILANNTVAANATPGSIEVIKVEDPGLGYDNYLVSEFASTTDIKIGGNPFYYGLGPAAKSVDNYYAGCILRITSGAAKDEYKIITNYFVDLETGSKVAVVDGEFEGNIIPTDTYEIYPYVYVFDNGGAMQTNCIARAIVSEAAGNTISKIEVLDSGTGYRQATAVIVPHPSVDVRANAVLRCIISPPGGHGAEAVYELGANRVGISTKFIEGETPFTTENDYRIVGILENPRFTNVTVQITDVSGGFAAGEQVYQYTDAMLTGSVEVSANTLVVGSGTLFEDALKVGDRVLISDGIDNALGTVAGVNSNTELLLSSPVSFSAVGCSISIVNAVPFGVASNVTVPGELSLSDVTVTGLSESLKLVGGETSCTARVNMAASIPIAVNGRSADGFQRYNQLTRFIGTVEGAFAEDELITQTSVIPYTQPQARFHSIVDNPSGPNDIMYVTNVYNSFRSATGNNVITGTESAGQFTLVAKYDGDLVPESGEVLYTEYLSPITRANNQSETIKLVLEF